MKKAFLVLLIFAVVTGSAFAFDILSYPPPLGGGAFMVDVGVGLRHVKDLWPVWLDMAIPPLWIQAEYALPTRVPISVGAGFSFARYKEDIFGVETSANVFNFHTRGSWHWAFPVSWLDFYTGLSIGADIISSKVEYWGISASETEPDFYYGVHVGTHFYFTRNIGAVAETGYPFFIKAGLALKFGGRETQQRTGRSSSGSSQSSGDYMLVNADTLNIRSGPSADHGVVGVAPRDARVQVLDRSGQWWRIRHGDIEGYVNSSFLRSASQG